MQNHSAAMQMSSLIWPKAVLFDWDNTLLDSMALTLKGFNSVRSHFSLPPLTRSCMHRLPATSLPELFRQWLSHDAEIDHGINIFHHSLKDQRSPLFPQTEPLLAWLHQLSVPMAVVSNKEGHKLRKEITHWNLSHLFFAVVGAGDTIENKPSPAPVWHALQQANLTASSHVWFVGDSLIDMEAAHHSGCLPISLCLQSQQSPRPKHHVSHLEGLTTTLQHCWHQHQGIHL